MTSARALQRANPRAVASARQQPSAATGRKIVGLRIGIATCPPYRREGAPHA